MKDPRAENCRGYAENGGKVTGVKLTYLPAPEARFELVRVDLVDEVAAQGNTVATVHVLDENGVPVRVNCYLGWPWEGWRFPRRLENRLLPGNPNVPYQHVITNGYNPGGTGAGAKPGPLAIYLGDQQGQPISDVIGGLGLPKKHHVSFDLVFKARSNGNGGDANPPDGDPGGGQGAPEPDTDVAAQLQRIEDKLNRLLQHMGVS